jgi:hypothetical protein
MAPRARRVSRVLEGVAMPDALPRIVSMISRRSGLSRFHFQRPVAAVRDHAAPVPHQLDRRLANRPTPRRAAAAPRGRRRCSGIWRGTSTRTIPAATREDRARAREAFSGFVTAPGLRRGPLAKRCRPVPAVAGPATKPPTNRFCQFRCPCLEPRAVRRFAVCTATLGNPRWGVQCVASIERRT